MKKLSTISLEEMERELQVLESPQSVLGGKVTYPADASIFNNILI